MPWWRRDLLVARATGADVITTDAKLETVDDGVAESLVEPEADRIAEAIQENIPEGRPPLSRRLPGAGRGFLRGDLRKVDQR